MINKVKELSIPYDLILVSLDVKFFYPDIQNSEGIADVRSAHKKYQQNTVRTQVLATLLALILL